MTTKHVTHKKSKRKQSPLQRRKISLLILLLICFPIGIVIFLFLISPQEEPVWVCSNDAVVYNLDGFLSYFDLEGTYTLEIDTGLNIEPVIFPKGLEYTSGTECGIEIVYRDSISGVELVNVVVNESFVSSRDDEPYFRCWDYPQPEGYDPDFQTICACEISIEGIEFTFRVATQYTEDATRAITESIDVVPSG
ncbi:MAG: hypothetical protein AAFR81_18675 [Chloroflexota bacterium]